MCVSLFRADNWLVDRGDDEAESHGLSPFGKVRGKDGAECHTSMDFSFPLSFMELTVLVSRVESAGTLEYSGC